MRIRPARKINARMHTVVVMRMLRFILIRFVVWVVVDIIAAFKRGQMSEFARQSNKTRNLSHTFKLRRIGFSGKGGS